MFLKKNLSKHLVDNRYDFAVLLNENTNILLKFIIELCLK